MVTSMTDFQVRPAVHSDLDTLLAFEQGIIEFERSFDEALKPGHIHYYDLEAMLGDSNCQILVVTDKDKIIASGYAKNCAIKTLCGEPTACLFRFYVRHT